MNVFDLAATLTLDTSKYSESLKEAEGSAQSLASSASKTFDSAGNSASGFGSKLATAAKVGAAGVTALAAGATALVGSIASATKETAAYGDNIDKMSQKLGLSAQAYQQWDYVLGQAGVDINSMSTGLKTLTNQIDNAKNGSADAQAKFEALGISLEDLNSMSREEVFEAAISGFQGMADSTERAALANDLFGRSGQELTPLFNSSIEDTQALKDAAMELGFVLSDDSVKAAAAYMDALDTMKRTIGGVKNALMSEFLPSITSVMEGLAKAFSGDKGGLEQVKQGITDFLNTITDRLPEFIQTGAEIVISLVQGIAENLPTMINSLVEAIVASLPVFIQGAIQLVAGLVGALPEIIAGLIAAIPDILKAIVEGFAPIVGDLGEVFTNAFNGILAIFAPIGEWFTARKEDIQNAFAAVDSWFNDKFTSAKNFVHSAWESIGSWFGERWSDIQGAMQSADSWFSEKFTSAKDAVHTAWSGIGSFFSEKWTEIQNVFSDAWNLFHGIGANIVQGLIAGIGAWIENAVNKARELVRRVIGGANSEAGINSPSKEFQKIGKYLDQGLAKGIDDNARGPIDKIKDLTQQIIAIVEAMNRQVDATLTKTVNDVAYVASMDYSEAMMNAKDYDEFFELAQKRAAKIEGEGIDLEKEGWKKNSDLLKEWEAQQTKASAATSVRVIGTSVTKQTAEAEQPININTTVKLDGKAVGEAAYTYTKKKVRMVGPQVVLT